MNFCAVHDPVIKRFARLLRSQRLAHAYLFIGPREIGKSETALAAAKLINCEDNRDGQRETFCGQCSSCLKIESGNHPDIFFIDRGESESIKIGQIRELINRLQLRPFEAAKKICIIRDVEHLTAEGSNALLKTLEEPSESSVFILTTSVPEENLGTVVSRCHVVSFRPESNRMVKARLVEEEALDAPAAHCLAAFAEGCTGRARRLKEEDFVRRKNEMIDNMVFQANNDPYLKKILTDKEQSKRLLDVLLSWYRDLLVLKAGGGTQHVVNSDRREDLQRAGPRHTFEQLKDIMTEIVKTRRMLGENLNVKIPLILLREKIWAR